MRCLSVKSSRSRRSYGIFASAIPRHDWWYRPAAAALIAGRFAEIAADDERATVTLTLTRPQPELAALLASPGVAIVPPECVAYYDGRDAAHPKFARHPVGSGPYVLDHAASEWPRTAVLVANPDMSPRTGSGPCPLPGASPVMLSHFSDPEPALRSFQAGELAALAPGQAQFAEVVHGGATIPGTLPPETSLTRFPALSSDMLVFRMKDPAIGQSPPRPEPPRIPSACPWAPTVPSSNCATRRTGCPPA